MKLLSGCPYYPHFTEEETEAQWGSVTGSGSLIQYVAEQGFSTWWFVSRAHIFILLQCSPPGILSTGLALHKADVIIIIVLLVVLSLGLEDLPLSCQLLSEGLTAKRKTVSFDFPRHSDLALEAEYVHFCRYWRWPIGGSNRLFLSRGNPAPRKIWRKGRSNFTTHML